MIRIGRNLRASSIDYFMTLMNLFNTKKEVWLLQRIMNWVTARDINIFSMVNKHLQCKILDFIMPKITHLGGATFTISLSVLLLFFEEVRMIALQGLISLTVSHLMVRIIKKNYRRLRPYVSLPGTRTFPNPLHDYSFPSGHTTASFSIAVVFSLHSLALALIIMPLALTIGISRMYLGLHYPTDCIFGALLGSLSSIIIVMIFYFF